MTASRKPFLEFLRKVFKENPETKKRCEKDINDPEWYTRAFDYLPNPLPEDKNDEYTLELLKLLFLTSTQSKYYSNLTKQVTDRLIELVKKIIKHAGDHLLDEKGFYDDEILDELGCKNKNAIPRAKLLTGYASLVSASLFANIVELLVPENTKTICYLLGIAEEDERVQTLLDRTENTAFLLEFISTSNSRYAKEEIKKRDSSFVYQLAPEETDENLLIRFEKEFKNVIKKHPVATTVVVVGAGSFGVAAIGIFAFVQALRKSSSSYQVQAEKSSFQTPTNRG